MGLHPKLLKLKDRLIRRASVSSPQAASSRADCVALLERVRPFALVMTSVMMVDSEAVESEGSTIRGALRLLTDSRLDDAAIDELVRDSTATLDARGRDRCLEYASDFLSANRDDGELALVLGAAVAAADGELRPAEHDTLLQLADLLGITEKRAEELLGSLRV